MQVILPFILLARVPLFERSLSHILRTGFPSGSSSVTGGDKTRESVLKMRRDVSRVIGVELDAVAVGVLEVDEEARDKDCCEAVL